MKHEKEKARDLETTGQSKSTHAVSEERDLLSSGKMPATPFFFFDGKLVATVVQGKAYRLNPILLGTGKWAEQVGREITKWLKKQGYYVVQLRDQEFFDKIEEGSKKLMARVLDFKSPIDEQNLERIPKYPLMALARAAFDPLFAQSIVQFEGCLGSRNGHLMLSLNYDKVEVGVEFFTMEKP